MNLPAGKSNKFKLDSWLDFFIKEEEMKIYYCKGIKSGI